MKVTYPWGWTTMRKEVKFVGKKQMFFSQNKMLVHKKQLDSTKINKFNMNLKEFNISSNLSFYYFFCFIVILRQI